MQMSPMFTVLQAIFSMSSGSLRLTRSTLARRVGLGSCELERQLAALERAGLVDARRVRLTFPGLAAAVTMRASSARSRQVTRVAA
jgi:DNA-binding transcriptional ArsR family regulator